MIAFTALAFKLASIAICTTVLATTCYVLHKTKVISNLFLEQETQQDSSSTLDRQYLLVKKHPLSVVDNIQQLILDNQTTNYLCRIINVNNEAIDDPDCTINTLNKEQDLANRAIDLKELFDKSSLINNGLEFNQSEYHLLNVNSLIYESLLQSRDQVDEEETANPKQAEIYIVAQQGEGKQDVIAKYVEAYPIHIDTNKLSINTQRPIKRLKSNLLIGEVFESSTLTDTSSFTCSIVSKNDLTTNLDQLPKAPCSIYRYTRSDTKKLFKKNHAIKSIHTGNNPGTLDKNKLVFVKLSTHHTLDELNNKFIKVYLDDGSTEYAKLKFNQIIIGNLDEENINQSTLFPIKSRMETFLVSKAPNTKGEDKKLSSLDIKEGEHKNYACQMSDATEDSNLFGNIDNTCIVRPFPSLNNKAQKILDIDTILSNRVPINKDLLSAQHHFTLTVDFNKFYNMVDFLKTNNKLRLIGTIHSKENLEFSTLNVDHYSSKEGIVGKVFYVLVKALEGKSITELTPNSYSNTGIKTSYLCSFDESDIKDQECSIYSPTTPTPKVNDLDFSESAPLTKGFSTSTDQYFLIKLNESQRISKLASTGIIYSNIDKDANNFKFKVERLLSGDLGKDKQLYFVN